MSKTIKITYHGNSVTVALVERPLLAKATSSPPTKRNE